MEDYIQRNSRDKARDERFKQNPKNGNVWDIRFYRNFVNRLCNNRIRQLMHTSDEGFCIIKKFEGLPVNEDGQAVAYKCPAGVWTIGYGHTKDVKEGDVWSKEKAEFMLWQELEDEYEHYVNSLVKVPLNQSQFDALVSFAFNLGSGALQRSTLRRRVNSQAHDEVPDQFNRWVKISGSFRAVWRRKCYLG